MKDKDKPIILSKKCGIKVSWSLDAQKAMGWYKENITEKTLTETRPNK